MATRDITQPESVPVSVTVTGVTTTSGPDSAANTVVVEVCAAIAGTPTTQTFNVTVY